MDTTLIINILLYVLLGWFLYRRFAPVKGLKNLPQNEFSSQLGKNRNKFLVDVREPNEFKIGHIPGASNIPLSQLKNRTGEIPKDREIYLYCQSGMRSKQAAKILSKEGFKSLSHLQGGISSWKGQTKR